MNFRVNYALTSKTGSKMGTDVAGTNQPVGGQSESAVLAFSARSTPMPEKSPSSNLNGGSSRHLFDWQRSRAVAAA